MVITMVITMMARCVERVKTKTPKKTQPREMHKVINVESKITWGLTAELTKWFCQNSHGRNGPNRNRWFTYVN
jgi:hypothetical protein